MLYLGLPLYTITLLLGQSFVYFLIIQVILGVKGWGVPSLSHVLRHKSQGIEKYKNTNCYKSTKCLLHFDSLF